MPRARKRARNESPADAAEISRRERQRELQRVALAAQSAGEVFVNPEKKKRKPLAARRLAERKSRRKAEKAAARRSVQKEVKKQKAAAPDVVIVPIFWKGEAKQMARVLSVCADVEKALADSGRRVLLDAGHKYTPGQKFAHWEHKGVTLRVELGPREAERGWCTLARTFKPGEPASRSMRIPIGAESLTAELDRLSALEAPADADEAFEVTAEGTEPAGSSSATVREGASVPLARRGGDDLEDDFNDVPTTGAQSGDESESTRPAKKKPKSAKSSGSAKPAETAHAERPTKKARIVNF